MTIVAAAGTDSCYGLPGIGTSRAQGEYKILINDMPFMRLPIDPTINVKDSKWNSRGWTYQEGLLSRRLLIFTETEVYFECKEMTCRESVDTELSPDLPSGPSTYFDGAFVPDHQGFSLYRISHHSAEVLYRIEEFRNRTFTNDHDILEGFKGILVFFEGRFGVEHCWGIPIFQSVDAMPSNRLERDKNMRWTSSKSFWAGMIAACTGYDRRLGFPSWSWTGWKQPTEETSLSTLFKYPGIVDDLEIRVELRDGRRVSWDSMGKLFSSRQRQRELSRFIHVKVWQFPIKLQEPPSSRDPSHSVERTRYEMSYWFVYFKLASWRLKFWESDIWHSPPIRMKPFSYNLAGTNAADKIVAKLLLPYRLHSGDGVVWSPLWVVMQVEGGWFEKVGVVEDPGGQFFRSGSDFSKIDMSFDWIKLG
jgi:hypothetical protein